MLVTNGVFQTGGRAVYGTMTNRVAVIKPVTVRSVNGHGVTVIAGYGAFGENAVRCVYLGEGAALVGFTLTNGATRGLGDNERERSGGGVWCESARAVVSDCLLTGNWADYFGGGAFGGTLNNCMLSSNIASSGQGGGAFGSTLNDCTLTGNYAVYGGGAADCTLTNCALSGNLALGADIEETFGDGGGVLRSTLNNCTLTGNRAGGRGGGASESTLNNCALNRNTAKDDGGGSYQCTLRLCALVSNSAWLGGGAFRGTLNNCMLTGNSAYQGGGANSGALSNCTLTGNSAQDVGGGTSLCTLNNCTLTGNLADDFGGGAVFGTMNNCIGYYNTVSSGDGAYANYCCLGSVNYSCTIPLPDGGVGNFTNAPLFVDQLSGNLRLQSNSPCINAGKNAFAPLGLPDLDGNARVVGGTVDVGAYEFQSPASAISYAWLQHYSLPLDGSADNTDHDGDRLTNWQEWRCGTDPTNALSVLRLLTPMLVGPDLVVRWESVPGRTYFLERSTNLASPATFLPLAIGIIGQAGSTTYRDTNTASGSRYFYRVGVE